MRRTPGWVLAGLLWLGTSILITGLVHHVSSREPGSTGHVDWLFVALLSTAVTGIVVALVRELRARPSPMQRAALAAIFNAKEPGALDAGSRRARTLGHQPLETGVGSLDAHRVGASDHEAEGDGA